MMTISRAGAIGDIHAEDRLLEMALNCLRDRVDVVLSVGDIVDGAGDANQCCELLRAAKVCVIRGNHERWLLNGEKRTLQDATQVSDLTQDSLEWISQLPATHTLETCDGPLLLCHGLGNDDMAVFLPSEYGVSGNASEALETILYESNVRYVINGHSHVRTVRTIDAITFINAGTLKRNQDPCFCIVDFAAREVEFLNLARGRIETGELVQLP